MESTKVNRFAFLSFVCGVLIVAGDCASSTSENQPFASNTPGMTGVGGGAGGSEFFNAVTSGTAQQPESRPALCPMDNFTRRCNCDSETGTVEGRQVCYTATGWAPCECYADPKTIIAGPNDTQVPDPAINKGPEHFDWRRTIPSGGECLAGHYKGEFAGQYSPSLTFTFGIFDITGTVEFDLYETGNGEFLEIENGVMEGIAIESVPFTGTIIGKLDCATGMVEAYLVDCTYVFALVLPAMFEGPALGQYDKINHVFVNGVWSVTEEDLNGDYPPPLPVTPGDPLPSIGFLTVCGGVGSWSASFAQ